MCRFPCDAFAPTPIDDIRGTPLLFRHRENNGFDKFELIAFERLFHLRVAASLLKPGSISITLRSGPMRFNWRIALRKSSRSNLPCCILAWLHGFFLVDGLLRSFDQGKYISHT